jgi:hypothetical protein
VIFSKIRADRRENNAVKLIALLMSCMLNTQQTPNPRSGRRYGHTG